MLKEFASILMEEVPVFIYIFVFLFGTVVGSFLNVCILRIPLEQEIIKTSSHCMSCGKKLHWYELIPLFSWLALRGKCSGCKEKISVQYPVIEATNGLLWILVLYVKSLTFDFVLICVLFSCLLTLSVIDARIKEIPNGTVLIIAGVGLIRAIMKAIPIIQNENFAFKHLLDIILGPVVVGGVLLLILLLSGGAAIGGGDVKLMMACGLFLGNKATVLSIVVGCIIGSVIHCTLMALKKAGRELAMGPYLSLGVAIATLWGEPILKWYLGMFATQ